MAIVEVRIDDRLIHGQVSNLWVPSLSVERLLIVDDEIVHDEDRKAALKFGCPPQCKLSVFDSQKAADKLSRRIDEGIRVMIVTVGPVPLVRMAEAGYQVPRVTVGNMSRRNDTKPAAKTAYVNAQEVAAFQKLIARGVDVAFQPTPSSRREDFSAALDHIAEGS